MTLCRDALLTKPCPHCADAMLRLFVITLQTATTPAAITLAQPDALLPVGGILVWADGVGNALDSVLDRAFVTHPTFSCTHTEYRDAALACCPNFAPDPVALPLPIQLTPTPGTVGIYAHDALGRPWTTWHGGPADRCIICGATLAGGYWGGPLDATGFAVCPAHVRLGPPPPATAAVGRPGQQEGHANG